jgi:sugar (pentulose or hexulose) kinase
VAAIDTSDVGGIGITSQRTGVVLLDDEGKELASWPNADGRGVGEGIALERDHAERVYAVAGRLPIMLYLPARLGWFRANRAEDAARVRWALSLADWAVFRLTDEAATEPTQAAELLVYDLAKGVWSDELCEQLGVPAKVLPAIHDAGSPAGTLTVVAAERLGLRKGIPVVGGGSDTQAASLGLGVTEPGQGSVIAGSTMLCQQPVEEPLIDDARRLWTSPHLSGGFVVEAHCGESGVPIDWTAALLGESHEWMDEAAGNAEPGSGGVSFIDAAPSNVGNFPLMRQGGMSFPVPLLALGRSREDVARAALEGVAFAAKAGLSWTQEVAGEFQDLALGGGVARSKSFARILAAAMNRPVRVATETNGSALGAAMVAAVAAGAHGTVNEAAKAMADPGETVEPELSWVGPTATAYAGWRERVQAMDENSMRVGHMIGPR